MSRWADGAYPDWWDEEDDPEDTDPTELDDLSHDYEVDRFYETVSRDADAAQDYSERTTDDHRR